MKYKKTEVKKPKMENKPKGKEKPMKMASGTKAGMTPPKKRTRGKC
jgi:hypothetical protein